MTTTSELHPGTADRVVAAAEAALALVPAGAPLALDVARPAADVDAAAWSAGAVAALNAGGSDASVAVLVGADLVQALATAPGGALDLGAALQPALDAAAAALGCAAGAGRSLDAGEVAALLTADAVAVPLHAGGVPTAVVVARPAAASSCCTGSPWRSPSSSAAPGSPSATCSRSPPATSSSSTAPPAAPPTCWSTAGSSPAARSSSSTRTSRSA